MRQILGTKVTFLNGILLNQLENTKIVEDLIEDVKHIVDNNFVEKKPPLFVKTTNDMSLNDNKNFIKFLDIIKDDLDFYFEKEKYTLINSYGCVYNGESYAETHNARHVSGLSGILFCSDEGPGTTFKELSFHCPDKKGRYLLFKPFFYHHDKKFNYKRDRITVSFNLDLNPLNAFG